MTITADQMKQYTALVRKLETDLHDQVDHSDALRAELQDAHTQALKRERTGDSFAEWLDAYITQVAMAWVLTCVFVRFLEDQHLIDPPRIATAEREREIMLRDHQQAYFRAHPTLTDTDYLLAIFRELAEAPAGEVFGEKRNPLYRLRISGDAGRELLTFFRDTDPDTGLLRRSFHQPDATPSLTPDTRFLGDLYQDLSIEAQKRYALLQTPDFVEEFILDHTLDPAIETFGLDEVRFIDPTCGSGHFLLGGFHRILALKQAARPGADPALLVREALDATHGVDLNPFAVAISRFRLTVAALFALGEPGKPMPFHNQMELPLHVAVGDSLIHGRHFHRFETDATMFTAQLELDQYRWEPGRFGTEDNDLLFGAEGKPGILMQQYHAVVGNPPYITVKDSTLRDVYRNHYASCHGKYALVCPFYERFFELAMGHPAQVNKNPLFNGATPRSLAGYVGLIVANSFMKRSFGKKLIEKVIPNTDLTHVIDSSGAYIPGHGTPTVILFGRNQPPQSDQIRAVLGIRGEPSTPKDPTQGRVWRSITVNISSPGFENDFVSVSDSPNDLFHTHPWSLRGGGALAAKEAIESLCPNTMDSIALHIGITAVTGEDAYFIHNTPSDSMRLNNLPTVKLTIGEHIRNWGLSEPLAAIWTHNNELMPRFIEKDSALARHLWMAKSVLSRRKRFGTLMLERGLTWHEWQELYTNKLQTPLSITFAFVATHNHFVLDRGGKVFKQTAPVIKLPEDATLDDHLGLLGLLNSSTVAFWGRMTFFQKGGAAEQWEDRLEWDGTKMKLVPIPEGRPLDLARRLDDLATQLGKLEPSALASTTVPTAEALDDARAQADLLLGQMIALQEELDWKCYGLYGLLSDPPLASDLDALSQVKLGERAFEIVLARKVKEGVIKTSWFKRHGSKPITEIPAHWPDWYRELVQARIDRIADTQFVRLIEQPEFKRRWNIDPWKKREEAALHTWLLDRLETARYIPQAPDARTLTADPDAPRDTSAEPTLTTVAELAHIASRDEDWLQVATRYTGDPSFDVETLLKRLILDQAVPFLPSQRYKKSGLKRRREWEKVWELQRQEDAIDRRTKLAKDHPDYLSEKTAEALKVKEVGKIPKPPNYRQSDFINGPIYSLRGKLDVPRERFTLYPGAESAEGSPRISWAGLDHQQRARALANHYFEAKSAGATPETLQLLLAGLLDLLPWLRQWHPEPDPDFGAPLHTFIASMITEQRQALGLTPEALEKVRLG